jgi:flagellar protein FlaG
MKIDAGAASPASDLVPAAAPRPAPAPAPDRAPLAPAPPLVRLVIEEDPASGAFIYKTLDWITGEVLLQLPREDILKALRASDYAAGALVKTQA